MTGIAEQLKTDAAVADERRGLVPAALPETKPEAPVAVLVEHLTKSLRGRPPQEARDGDQ